MALDFDKYCLVDGSPTTVLPAPRHRSSLANRKLSGKPKYRNDTPSLTEQLEIDFGDYCSGSCGDLRSQGIIREGRGALKRESVYQCSKEVRLIHNTDAAGVGRKKIEFSPGTASEFSLPIIDSLCSSDEEISLFGRNRASLMSISEQSMTSSYGGGIEFCIDDSTITLTPLPAAMQRSLSARFALPHSSAKSECHSSRASSPKARCSPIKKMIDPFVKSKYRRNPLSNFYETNGETVSEVAGISCKKTVRQSQQGDILEKPHHVEYEYDNQNVKENQHSVPHCSSAYRNGLLKTGHKHGVPYFRFSVDSLEDVYVAKIWRVENGSTWVYTFHSLPHRRKRGTSGWGFKECNRESFMVAKMHVSCQQYTEFKGLGQSNDSMVTEFVLHDILHSRRSTVSQDNASCKLHPELENAAIVMQVPLEKRESLKFKSGDKKIDETPPNLVDICRVGKSKGASHTSNHWMMHVVLPSGTHSLPISGSCGPSPLLDRWRLGGGCDCGGWDTACPLKIFTNKVVEGQPLIDNQSRADLFVQGRKDNMPAFTMRVIKDGMYAVDFQAQLSSLQAFSICVAILHAAEVEIGQELSKQSDSFMIYTEEEIKTMQAEKEMCKAANKMDELMPSFILSPPFSPIARV